MIKNEWICTDPDNKQYGREINNTTFEFKEQGIQILIDLTYYSNETIQQFLDPYGYKLFDKTLTNWIIAECIFEQESGLY